MIQYRRGPCGVVRLFQIKGSVFPFSFFVATPCAFLTALLRYSIENEWVQGLGSADDPKGLLKDNTTWSGFVFLVGFLVVFRTSQAYARFWDGCTSMHRMQSEWFNACSCLMAFCKHSQQDKAMIDEFKHKLVRLFSMLHALALADIEDTMSSDGEEAAAFKYQLIDATSLGNEALKAVKESNAKVQLVFQWIQHLIVEAIGTGVLAIPPPILSRAFQEIASGMVAFEEAIKISTIPFPFPYAQTTECLLLMHWVVTPLVVAQWVSTPWWGALFSFITVFIYWSLNSIATEIENPFGADANDIDAEGLQKDLNRHLLLMLEPEVLTTPKLTEELRGMIWNYSEEALYRAGKEDSLEEAWTIMEDTASLGVEARRSSRASRIAQHRRSRTGHTAVSTVDSGEGSRRRRDRRPAFHLPEVAPGGSQQHLGRIRNSTNAFASEEGVEANVSADIKEGSSAWAGATWDTSSLRAVRGSLKLGEDQALQHGNASLNGHTGDVDSIRKMSSDSTRQSSPVALGAAMRKGDWQQPAGDGGGLNGLEASPSCSSSAGVSAARQQAGRIPPDGVHVAVDPPLFATGDNSRSRMGARAYKPPKG